MPPSFLCVYYFSLSLPLFLSLVSSHFSYYTHEDSLQVICTVDFALYMCTRGVCVCSRLSLSLCVCLWYCQGRGFRHFCHQSDGQLAFQPWTAAQRGRDTGTCLHCGTVPCAPVPPCLLLMSVHLDCAHRPQFSAVSSSSMNTPGSPPAMIRIRLAAPRP